MPPTFQHTLHHTLHQTATQCLHQARRVIEPRLRAGLQRLPHHPGSTGLALALNLAHAQGLLGDLSPLEAKLIAVRATDLGLVCGVRVRHGRFHPAWRCEPFDVRLSASAQDLLALAQGKVDPDSLFFLRRLGLEGDMALAVWIKHQWGAMPRTSGSF